MSKKLHLASHFVAERLTLSKPSGMIDREKSIVYGVRIVNPESRNGYRYPTPVLAKSTEIYEGRAVNVGHRKNPTDFDDPLVKFGVLKNIRVEDGGLAGDLHYNPKHAFAEPFLWACENNPSQYSLSHHARCEWEKRPAADGKRVAKAILEVASVDIVSEGGTTFGVFESKGDSVETEEYVVDPKAIAQSITDQSGLEAFLKDMFASLPQGVDAMAAVETVMMGMAEVSPKEVTENEEEDIPDEEMMEESFKRLARRGKLGKWAAESLRKVYAKRRTNKRIAWAKEMCRKEGLSQDFVSEAFVSVLAKSSESEAKILIADRKELTKHQANKPRTTPAGSSGSKSAKQLAEEFTLD